MGKIYADAKSKSFGGYSFYNSNTRINAYLRKKKERKNLENAGFKVCNITLKNAISQEKKINAHKEYWVFGPKFCGANFDKAGWKDKGLVYSTFGRLEKKYKFKDGQLHIYTKYMNITKQYFKVYVFVNNNRDIVKSIWYIM